MVVPYGTVTSYSGSGLGALLADKEKQVPPSTENSPI